MSNLNLHYASFDIGGRREYAIVRDDSLEVHTTDGTFTVALPRGGAAIKRARTKQVHVEPEPGLSGGEWLVRELAAAARDRTCYRYELKLGSATTLQINGLDYDDLGAFGENLMSLSVGAPSHGALLLLRRDRCLQGAARRS